MSIQQSKKQSDLEKRLKILRQQVYGKEQVSGIRYPVSSEKDSTTSDITYLNQDLLKILAFSSVAIGAQIILFFLTRNHVINLNLF